VTDFVFVDTSVWVKHLREGDHQMVELLEPSDTKEAKLDEKKFNGPRVSQGWREKLIVQISTDKKSICIGYKEHKGHLESKLDKIWNYK